MAVVERQFFLLTSNTITRPSSRATQACSALGVLLFHCLQMFVVGIRSSHYCFPFLFSLFFDDTDDVEP